MKFHTIMFVYTLMLTLGCVTASSSQGPSAAPRITKSPQTVATVIGPSRFQVCDDARWVFHSAFAELNHFSSPRA